MSIRFTVGGPTDTQDKIHGWESELQAASARGAAGGATLTLGDAYEVKHLSVQDIASGHLLDASYTIRWRHLVLYGQHPHGELELDDSNEPIALHEGIGKEGLQAALKAAEELGDDFEVSVLQVAALRFVALLLHNENVDLIMPYAPNLTSLDNYTPVPVSDALAVLQPMAMEVLSADAGPEPTGG